ncbi:uncharacterized protein LOC143696576 [Agelaius phoeniceus]|uniref:uncharacterized protein LOC143696576 n=1 Tax=Agelaius phoeniceus TaxID=39638 RepID=UPI0040551B38
MEEKEEGLKAANGSAGPSPRFKCSKPRPAQPLWGAVHLCTSHPPHLCRPRPSHLCRPRPPGPRPARARKSRRIRARPAFCGGCSSRRVAGPSLGAVRKLGPGAAPGAARSPRHSGGTGTGIWARGFGSWSRRCLLWKLGRAASSSASNVRVLGPDDRGGLGAGIRTGIAAGGKSRSGTGTGTEPSAAAPAGAGLGSRRGSDDTGSRGCTAAAPTRRMALFPGAATGSRLAAGRTRRPSVPAPGPHGPCRSLRGDTEPGPGPRGRRSPGARSGTSGAGSPRAEGAVPPLSLSTAPGVRAGPCSGRSSDTCRSQAVSPAFLSTLMPATVLRSNSLLRWKRTGTITAECYWQ